MNQTNSKKLLAKNLHHLHFHLSSLAYYNNNAFSAEETLIEDYDFKSLLKGDFRNEVLSLESIRLLNKFRVAWLDYKKSVNYGEDAFFIFYDPIWQKIVINDLIPAIHCIENDLAINEIEFIPINSHFNPSARPTAEGILERGQTLYGLLLKHGIVSRNYMD